MREIDLSEKNKIIAGAKKYKINSSKLFASSIGLNLANSLISSIFDIISKKNLLDNNNSMIQKLPFLNSQGFMRFGADINKTAFSSRI